MFRLIPIIFLGIFAIYFQKIIVRLNNLLNLKLSPIHVYIILLLLLLPALNIFNIYFLILLHLFETGIIIELLNIFLKRVNINSFQNIWSGIYNSFTFPIILTILIFIYGYYNINNVQRQEYRIQSEKKLSKDYKIGLISDVHSGIALDFEKMKKYVKELNKEELDFLILAGDIVDEQTTLKELKNMFIEISNIKTKFGIFYIYGNHDLSKYTKKPKYTREELYEAIKKVNINILKDDIFKIEDIVLVGREDKSNELRKTSQELIDKVERNNYILLVDHHPVELENNSNLGYDMQVSGHTHNGQIIPFNWIIKGFHLAELLYGHRKFGEMDVIVSSGMSGWGYPIRTAGNSEYVIINLESRN